MKVKLVSHAGIIVETADTCILTDPWLFGKAFNDSWSLLCEPVLDEGDLSNVEYLWISHEHPDHLHFPSLKSLPDEFKNRVTVLFQKIPSKNAYNSLRNIVGFKNIIELPHRSRVKLTQNTDVYCYHSRQIDSALAVISGEEKLLNINDVEVSGKDRKILRTDLGKVNCVLNQFSAAGYGGDVDHEVRIPEMNRLIIDNMIEDSRALHADTTVPFASFVYFSCEDNKYINPYANTPRTVLERFESAGMGMKILRPGESWEFGEPVDNDDSVHWYDEVYSGLSELPISKPEQVDIEQIKKAFRSRVKQLHRNYPRLFLKLIKPIAIRVPDLRLVLRISLAEGSIDCVDEHEDFDLEVLSQPLWYGFKYPWGIQTLGVSGRLQLHRNAKHWRRLRYLFAMNSAGIHLRKEFLFSPKFAYFLRERGVGLIGQVIYRLKRAERG